MVSVFITNALLETIEFLTSRVFAPDTSRRTLKEPPTPAAAAGVRRLVVPMARRTEPETR